MGDRTVIMEGAPKEIVDRNIADAKRQTTEKLKDCDSFVVIMIKGKDVATFGIAPLIHVPKFMFGMVGWIHKNIKIYNDVRKKLMQKEQTEGGNGERKL